jgi:iron-sulfur cluster assembly enzyme ISCU, mitochondrial
VHCSMLAEDAIKSAIRDYQSKRAKRMPTLGPESPVAVGAT